jgi:hypothetical protein
MHVPTTASRSSPQVRRATLAETRRQEALEGLKEAEKAE